MIGGCLSRNSYKGAEVVDAVWCLPSGTVPAPLFADRRRICQAKINIRLTVSA